MSGLRACIAAAALLAALGSSSCAVGVGPGYGDGGYAGVGAAVIMSVLLLAAVFMEAGLMEGLGPAVLWAVGTAAAAARLRRFPAGTLVVVVTRAKCPQGRHPNKRAPRTARGPGLNGLMIRPS